MSATEAVNTDAGAEVANVDTQISEQPEVKPAVVHEEIVIHEDALDATFHAASRSIDQLLWQGNAEVAKAVTLLGPGIVVLPMFGRVSGVDDKKCMSYDAHPKRAARTGLMDRIDFMSKFGYLDPGRLLQELAGGKHGLDARLKTLSDVDLQDEVAALQDWQKKANGRMMTLEKRAAYAFIGMRVGTADRGAIKRAFRRKALELHPDKGGDVERFQLLQEMKDLLIEPTAKELEDKEKEEKDNEKEREAEAGKDKKEKDKDKDKEKADDKDKDKEEKKDGEEEDCEDTDFSDDEYDVDEEFKKMFPEYGKKKKKKKKDDDEWGDLGRGEEFNRDKHVAARRKLHRVMTEMWERAGKLSAEIKRSQAADSGGEALRTLRKFADRFANVEISKLKENDPKKAERIFRRFLEHGSEIICAAGAVDAVATVSCIAMQVNFPLLAKAPSPDLQAKTSALIEAIETLPSVFERHVGPVEELLGNRREAAKEAEAAATAPVKLRIVMPDMTNLVKQGDQELPGVSTAEIEMPPGSTVADLRAAALQVFGRAAARLFCGGRFLGSDKMPLATIPQVQAGAAVQCLPSNKVLSSNAAAAPQPKGAAALNKIQMPVEAGASADAATEGASPAQQQPNPHALPEGSLGKAIDASSSARRGGSAAKVGIRDAQSAAPQDGDAKEEVQSAKPEEVQAAGNAQDVVAVEAPVQDFEAAGAERRAAKAEEERKAREEEEAARLKEQKEKELASQKAEQERLEAEARAKEEVERKAAENNDAEDDAEEGEDDWFDDFFDSAKKAADDKAALQKKEAEKREAEERKRKEELEIEEARKRAEEKANRKEVQEKGLSAMEKRLQAQKQAAEAKKKLEAEKKKALEAKKKVDEEKQRAEEAKQNAEMDRRKAEEEARKKQDAVKCRDLVTAKEEPVQHLQQARTQWDQNWDAPSCAGGRREDGLAIFCHPCNCWISLSAPFDHCGFDRHCQEKDFHYNWID